MSENYESIKAGEYTIYIPPNMSFDNNIPRIVVFPRRTGEKDIGVSNVM